MGLCGGSCVGLAAYVGADTTRMFAAAFSAESELGSGR
jgi:hypothetical protein